MDGHLTQDEFSYALDLAMKGCHHISTIQKDALKRRYQADVGVEE
jgi:ribonuclease PH